MLHLEGISNTEERKINNQAIDDQQDSEGDSKACTSLANVIYRLSTECPLECFNAGWPVVLAASISSRYPPAGKAGAGTWLKTDSVWTGLFFSVNSNVRQRFGVFFF